MAKALKAVAIVAGVAALAIVTGGAAAGLGLSLATTAFGVSASALLATSALASTAAGLLTKAPKVPTAQTDRLTASIDPRAFRKTVLGQTAFPVDVRYEEWSGNDQEYCDWIVALASHAIDGIEEIWLNTEMAWSQTTGVTAKYRGYFSIPNLVLEGSPANAFSFASGRWNGSARLTGCAYARLRFKVTGNSKKAESPFASGIPNRITIIGRGAKLYDPRRDSTVPGGSGPMRAGDQSTWRYTTDDGAVIGENLPLHILRVVLGWRIRNPVTGEMKLATGSGVPARRLNLGSWITAANLADEQVNRSAGGTEPRYHGAGVISEGDEPKTSLDAMCAACCARFRDTSGKLSIAISYNDLANAATDDGLGNDDVVGGFTWDSDPSLAATPNVIRGRYVDASTNSLYQLVDYPEVRLASPDGQDRIFPLDLGVVESASHAQRVAKQVLQRRQYQREFTAPFDIRAWKYTVGDLVPFTFAPLSFTRALFRVKEQELGQGGTCNMTLTVEHPQIYAFDRDDAAPVLAAEPIVYDASRNPLILAIADAGNTATWDGVTGTAKPADNATNSADPNSPFGPGGTVGDVQAAIDAAKARQDVIENQVIPAIDAAGAAAGQRITEARAAADLALSTIESEVDRVDQRIDNLSASGGYDDTALTAEIRRVDEVSLGRDAALGTRIDTVSASITTADTDIRALVQTKEQAAVDRENAIARRVDEIIASGGGSDEADLIARAEIQRVEQAAILRDTALASRATSMEASATAGTVGSGKNEKFSVWPVVLDYPTGWMTWAAGGNYRWERRAGINSSPYCIVTLNDNAEVESGFYQQVPVYAGKWIVEVTAQSDISGLRGAGVTLHGQHSLDFCADPDINEFAGDKASSTRSWTKMFTFTQAFVDSIGGLVNFHAMHGWFGFGRGVAAKYMFWHRMVLRPATATEIREDKVSRTDLPAVAARITTAENTLADLPNRYATAQRASNIEAYVGPFGGRISSLETVTSNGTFATASRAEEIASYAGGLGATVTQQAGTIAGLGQRTAAYFKVTAVAGDNRAYLSIFADANSGGGVAIGGDLLVDGNVLVAGTITARKFDRFSMSREGSATWSGSITPQAGQTVGVPWSLSLPQIPPVGRFIYEYTFAMTTNAGQVQYAGQDRNRPVNNHYVEDGGGLILFAADGQGNTYRPRPNSSDVVLATTDFVPTFNASVRRGSLDSTEDGGDYVNHYIAATYTLTEIRLKVTWVAI